MMKESLFVVRFSLFPLYSIAEFFPTSYFSFLLKLNSFLVYIIPSLFHKVSNTKTTIAEAEMALYQFDIVAKASLFALVFPFFFESSWLQAELI
jgi:hypothetical protein